MQFQQNAFENMWLLLLDNLGKNETKIVLDGALP